MLPTDFKIHCFSEVERTITDVKYVKSPIGIHITCLCCGEKRNIFLDIPQYAEIALEEGTIDKLIYKNGRPVMYQKKILTAYVKGGAPAQYEKYDEFKWEDVHFDVMAAQTVAVLHELGRVGLTAKLVDFAKYSFKKTA